MSKQPDPSICTAEEIFDYAAAMAEKMHPGDDCMQRALRCGFYEAFVNMLIAERDRREGSS